MSGCDDACGRILLVAVTYHPAKPFLPSYVRIKSFVCGDLVLLKIETPHVISKDVYGKTSSYKKVLPSEPKESKKVLTKDAFLFSQEVRYRSGSTWLRDVVIGTKLSFKRVRRRKCNKRDSILETRVATNARSRLLTLREKK